MERKRIEKLVALLLVGILIPVSLFPFHIQADTITNSNVNINYYLESVTETTSGSYMQTYRVEFVFDQSYLGWISSKMVGTYIVDNNVPITTSQFTKTQAIYVNGAIADTSFTIVTQNTQNGGALQSLSQSIQNSNVTPLADLSTLDDILNVLTDISNNIEIDVLGELQNIVANTSLANDYLEIISQLRQYNFPIESFNAISFLFNRFPIVDFITYGSWTYPLFQVPANSNVGRIYYYSGNADIYRDFICILNVHANRQPFTITNSTNYMYDEFSYNGRYNIFNFKFKAPTTGTGYSEINTNMDLLMCPVYFGLHNYKRVSTDFALVFGLDNRLLDDLHALAIGTNQSQSASGSLDQATSQFSDDANDLVTIEETFNDSMNQSLQNVNPTFNMGSSFLTSANWVSQQFNRIVNNTPFASLITFGLTLGLGLLIIGKVRK